MAPLGTVGLVEVPVPVVPVVPVVQVMGVDLVEHRGTIRSTARSFLLCTAAPVACPWYTEIARWMCFGKAFRRRRRHQMRRHVGRRREQQATASRGYWLVDCGTPPYTLRRISTS